MGGYVKPKYRLNKSATAEPKKPSRNKLVVQANECYHHILPLVITAMQLQPLRFFLSPHVVLVIIANLKRTF